MIIGTNALQQLAFNIMDYKGNVLTSTNASELVSINPEVALDPTDTIGPELTEMSNSTVPVAAQPSTAQTSDSRINNLQLRTTQLVMPADQTYV